MNLSIGKIITFGVVAMFIVFAFIGCGSAVSFTNEEVGLRSQFKQKIDERTAFYDKMWKIINQTGQIAVKNDSSFRKNIDIIMSQRKDGEELVMKWVQESNPNANYDQVAGLYNKLAQSVEAQREGFFIEEKSIQDIVRLHTNLLQQIPGSIFNIFFNRQPLEYKPITSSRTEEVIKSGKDDNVDLF